MIVSVSYNFPKSRERKDLALAYGSGIVLASSIMFIRVMVWVSIFALPVAKQLFLPLLMMLLVSLVPAWKVFKKPSNTSEATPLSPGNPLDIKNAILFVLLYVGITWLMSASRQWMSQTMTYLTGAVAGIADIDAITISTAKWAAASPVETHEAATIVLLAVMSNSLFKFLVSVLNGARDIRKTVGLGYGLILAVGAGWLLFWLL